MPTLTRLPDWVWFAAFLAAGSVLHLVNIGGRSLWFDEAISVLAVRYDLARIIAQRLEPMAPPLYLVLSGAVLSAADARMAVGRHHGAVV